jgi:hypothetical protein
MPHLIHFFAAISRHWIIYTFTPRQGAGNDNENRQNAVQGGRARSFPGHFQCIKAPDSAI